MTIAINPFGTVGHNHLELSMRAKDARGVSLASQNRGFSTAVQLAR